MAAIACGEYLEAGIVEVLNKLDEVKDVDDDDPFEDLETSDPNSANVASLMIIVHAHWCTCSPYRNAENYICGTAIG